jgi:hypothetical protein
MMKGKRQTLSTLHCQCEGEPWQCPARRTGPGSGSQVCWEPYSLSLFESDSETILAIAFKVVGFAHHRIAEACALPVNDTRAADGGNGAGQVPAISGYAAFFRV